MAGSSLRDEAAGYLEAIYGNARVELLVGGKKVDIVCGLRELGKPTDLFVEVKDKSGLLHRADIAKIFTDYSGILAQGRSARLLVVTRAGLASGAEAFVESQHAVFHQTIWELEDSALGLIPYVTAQKDVFEEENLSSYYIPARAKLAVYDNEQKRSLQAQPAPLFEIIQDWLEANKPAPLAILGGYGAGKSSFAKRLLSHQAEKALSDPAARRPILIKLGNITRSVGLDSLLGSLFTSEYEVRGYSFRRFKELNAKGRLLIILDGFDEMKHAMTWTEFRNEIAELNTLNAGNSRIILLGRPNAFTSDDEHMEILRGRRRVPGGTRRLQDWPEFVEYELQSFTREERHDFIAKFLEVSERGERDEEADLETIHARAVEVNALADQDEEVFGKPVHSRILVELALDPEFDLSGFKQGLSRWALYSEFFSLLARRETRKPARSPIEAKFRLEFLRQVALWLWEEREGSTSFRASEVPAYILASLPDGDADNDDDKCREYLAGAFLERKAGDTFYFAHRSFAEFLVAEQLALSAPSAHQHERYCSLVRDGVESFLSWAPDELKVGSWCKSLATGSGHLTPEYLLFLSVVSDGFDKMATQINVESPWRPIVDLLGTHESHPLERQRIVAECILQGTDEAIALMLSTITRFPMLLVDYSDDDFPPSPLIPLSQGLTAALIQRIVGSIREETPMPRHTVSESRLFVLQITRASIEIEGDSDSRSVSLSWSALADALETAMEEIGVSVGLPSSRKDLGELPVQRMPYLTIRSLMKEKFSRFFHEMVLKKGGLDSVSVVSQVQRRGRPK